MLVYLLLESQKFHNDVFQLVIEGFKKTNVHGVMVESLQHTVIG